MRRFFRSKLSVVSLIVDCFIWWYRDFLVQLASMILRVLRFIWLYLGLQDVIKRFFTPWKNVNNIAGWFVGISVKIIYLLAVFPIYLLFIICGASIIMFELVIIPLLILQILIW